MAGNTITANSTISFATTDANLNGTSTATITWANATSSWNTTVAYNGTWNGSIAGLNSNLGDGSVSVSIVTRDWFGNQKTVTSSGWNLNTTMVRTTFSLDTSDARCQQCRQLCWRLCPIYRNTACGRLLYHDGANRCRRDWWLQHTKNSTQTWTYRSGSQQNYTSGQLWINITTTDAYGRTAVDVYTFTIDDEVTSTPTLATTGTQTIINGSTYLGANGRITLANLIDAGGVGVDSAECFWNANTQAKPIPQQHH